MENSPNIYKTARIEAQMTQETAADSVGVSVTALKDYEAYARIPPVCIVERMCVAYDSRVLAYQHMRLISGRIQVVPEVQARDLQTAAIRLYNRVAAFTRKNRGEELLEIAEDGRISPDERPLYDEIAEDLKDLYQAGLEWELASEKA